MRDWGYLHGGLRAFARSFGEQVSQNILGLWNIIPDYRVPRPAMSACFLTRPGRSALESATLQDCVGKARGPVIRDLGKCA